MSMYDFEIVCVTSRRLCAEPIEVRIARLLSGGVSRVILREKDLSPREYAELAEKVLKYNNFDKRISLHFYPEVCKALNYKSLHVSMQALINDENIRKSVDFLGASVHSPEEAQAAETLGADYVIAGHIFETDCKKGLPPRGLDFLRDICAGVEIPVYAIGGISENNISQVMRCGAKGACLMSSLMKCGDAAGYVSCLREAPNR